MKFRAYLSFLLALTMLPAAPPSVDPREEALVAKRRSYWAFQAPQRTPVPAGQHPVDFFEPAKNEALEARALVRRLTLDLTGLPPAPGEVEAYLADRQPGAYERLVKRLMATPAYAERWAQKWLDVVRYADTNGFELDAERPHAWRYRDYVIRSFAANKPYNRFLEEQLAGDELYPTSQDALIATGFLRAGPRHVVGGNQDEEQNRQEDLMEMTHSVSTAFLGLTIGCARCHNHKFDPILQSDYYRLQAVFGATEFRDIQLATGEEAIAADERMAAHKARLKPLFDEIKAMEKPYLEKYKADAKATLEPQFRAILDVPKAELKTEEQKRLRHEAERQITPTWDEVVALLPAELKTRRAELRKQIAVLELDKPAPAPFAYGVFSVSSARPTHILKVGDHKKKLAPVEPGLPLVLAPDLGNLDQQPQGRRAALAKWLASGEHPLTARVMVNRIWQFRMGKGIVATPNDFGALGARPTNKKLLDWLATEFVASGWNVQHLDRLIVTSAAYRQRTPQRRRMEGEMLRDAMLAASGKLNRKMYGPPVRTPIEPEIYEIIFTEFETDNLWPLPKDAREMDRRSLYLLNKRTVRLPLLANFDQPDTMTSCPERAESTHALQSLTMLNSDFVQQQAKRFASHLKGTPEEIVAQGYRLALTRPPTREETQLALEFFAKGGNVEDFALALFNRNDFVYLP
ncbi:MAG: DUF1549 and DUF1553 domain-containing protein [Bryobacter sp.]|nr:DUF1549 and DUF1553 domain-containing protein [Bryobacter sp.]